MKDPVKLLCACLLAVVLTGACTKVNPAFHGEAADAESPAPEVDGASPSPDAVLPLPDAAALTPDTAALPDAAPPPADAVLAPPDAPAPDAPVAGGTWRYDFETSDQGWTDLRYGFYHQPRTPVARSTAHAFAGTYSLEISIDTMNGYITPTMGVTISEALPARTRITYHLWFPADGSIEAVQPYVLYDKPGFSAPQWGGIDPVLFTSALKAGAWNTVTHQVPDDIIGKVWEVGLEWRTAGDRKTKVYMDAITW